MLRKKDDQVHLQLGLDVFATVPVRVAGLVNGFDGSRQGDQLLFRVFKLILLGDCLQNVIKGFLFKINPQRCEGV